MSSELRVDKIIPVDGVPSGGGGGIIQVKNLEYETIFSSSHSNSSYVDVTGFNLDITPKFNTSKILVSAEVAGGLNDNVGYNFKFQVVRTPSGGSSTAIGIPSAGTHPMTGGYNLYDSSASVPYIFGMSKTFFDSPATTSSVNYKVQVAHSHAGSGAVVYVNRRGSSSDWRSISTLTLMEISA